VTGLVEGFAHVAECWAADEKKGPGEQVLREVEAWLARRKAEGRAAPVFVFVNLMESHMPYSFRPASVAAVRGDAAVNGARAATAVGDREANAHTIGVQRLADSSLEDLRAAYDGAVREADGVTDAILDRLRGAGLLEGAVVVVTSDHGENLGEGGALGHQLSVHDRVLHVPLAIRWPGRFEGGRVDAQVRLQDLYPTLLEAAGAAVPEPCGKDAIPLGPGPVEARTLVAEYGPLLDHLENATRTLPRAPASAFEPFHRAFVAVQDPPGAPGARKYVRVTRFERRGAPGPATERLYDTAADPAEERDLLAAEGGAPAEAAALARLRAAADGGR
jgi:arylsulfatase A-like enzyme